MKILVTGGTGFIGSHIADLLLEKGHEVRCIIRNTSNLQWVEGKDIELIEASLSDKGSLVNAVRGVDIVIHVAGLTAAKNYNEFIKGNRDGTKNLLEAVLEAAPNIKRFLHVSSQTVAGPSKSLESAVDSSSPLNPITSYGKSKKAAEDIVQEYQNKFPITIIRPSAVYGPRDTAIYSVFKSAKFGLGTLIGFKPKYVSLVHSDDLSRAIVDAAFSEGTIGKAYFIGSDIFYTWNEIMDIFKESFGSKFFVKLKLPHFLVLVIAYISEIMGKFSKKPPVFNYEKGIDFIQEFWICSNKDAARDFNFKQQVDIKTGISSTIEWYKDKGWL